MLPDLSYPTEAISKLFRSSGLSKHPTPVIVDIVTFMNIVLECIYIYICLTDYFDSLAICLCDYTSGVGRSLTAC